MAPATPVIPVPFPYGVADAAGRTAYVADGAGGIRAFDLADGHPLWRTDAAERPLLVFGDRLAALKRRKPSVLEIVVLDVGAPDKPLLTTPPIALPQWVVAGLVDNDRFALAARIDEAGRLEIAWAAHARYEGGASPPPRVVRGSERSAGGTIHVDLASGRTETGEAFRAPPSAKGSGAADASVLAPAMAAGALAAHIVAHRLYSIVDAGGSRLALRAADLATARIVWEVPLASGSARPPPRRQ
jgi:hypothetical protein